MSTDDKRPRNASSKIAHERFVVSVDGQAKMSFARLEEAQRESDRITQKYPRVVVHILDSDRPLVRETPDAPGAAPEAKPKGKRAAVAVEMADAEAEAETGE
jgi:hypothetical protein